MFSIHRRILCLVFFLAAGGALGLDIANWSAPATWAPPRSGSAGGARVAGESNPLPLIAINPPCRGADTRGFGFGGAYGPPSLAGGAIRSFTIVGTCGIPASAAAVSFNFTVTNNPTFGDIRVYPAGGAAVVSTLNWGPGTGNVANAAVVAIGTGGAITVQVDGPGPLDLVYDINGYYPNSSASNPLATGEQLLLFGNVSGNTGVIDVRNLQATAGARALFARCDSTGTGSTAIGAFENATTGLTAGVFSQAVSSTDLSAGLSAVELATSGKVFGVVGQTSSPANNAAGVKGIGGTGESAGGGVAGSPGVIGTAKTDPGVTGISQDRGVIGLLFNGGGTFQAVGDPATNLGGPVYGVYDFGHFCASGAKPFVEPHPTDASRVVRYVALEGPEAGTYFRGSARTSGREFVIEVPESFRIVTDEEGITVQLTPVGELASMAVISQDLNAIRVRASRDVRFHYLVQGVRRAFKNWEAIAEGGEFVPRSPDERIPAYLTEEARARLIANGTYNADGTVNLGTASRLGWDSSWARREAAKRGAGAPPN